MRSILIVVLAAGASRRLGQPKQLLAAGQKVLVQHTVEECVASEVGPVYVVLGAYADRIRPHLSQHGCQILYNEKWAEGIGSSLRYGLSQMPYKEMDGVIVVLGDQPYFKGKLLKQIVEKQKKTKAKIIISKYTSAAGPPSLFMQEIFPELLQLTGDEGAKPIVKKYRAEVDYVSFPAGYIDIDIADDLSHLDHFEGGD